ncbi:MAG: GNAT family N-acetyltransferase [Firmicutes bacterium]|nr:GNAT family N-acetyltransferase [Bacillota bacterium]
MYTGKLVKLRAYKQEDAALAQEYYNDPEVKRFLVPGIPYPLTLPEEERWVLSQSANNDVYSFAIETLEDAQYIGGCGINSVDWKNSVAQAGIFIGDKNFWGKGYGTDAMQVLVRFVFEQMNVNKVSLNTYSFNTRAFKSYLKCGFKQEGTLRQALFRDGRYHDIYVMGLLREEY